MASGNTFEFNQEAYDRIIFKESLFGDDPSSHVDTEDGKKKLTSLLNRETRLYLHAVTLSDYLRKRRIPRGLRIQKAPTVGLNNPDFCQKWCEITNKCSFDLMVLIIQEMNDQLTEVRSQIKDTRGKLETDYMDKTALKTLLDECEKYKEKFQTELTLVKKKKFMRDTEDYEKDKVYLWRSGRSRRGENQQRTTHGGYYTAADTDSDAYSSASTSSSFLEVRAIPPKGRERGRGRGKGQRGKNAGGERKNSMFPGYMTRSHNR